jgi:hypothetical protein
MDLLTSSAAATVTFAARKPSLIVSWWCTCYATTIIFFRVCGRYIRSEKMFKEDLVMLGAVSLLLVRMGLAQAILINGTNDVVLTALGLTADDIARRELGSKLVLASRILYSA